MSSMRLLCQPTFIADFSQVQSVLTHVTGSGRDAKHHIQIRIAGALEPLAITCSSAHLLDHLASLIDGYCCLINGDSKPSVWKRTDGKVLYCAVCNAVILYAACCILCYLLCPDRREGGNKCCFCKSVRLSVSLSVPPSVAYVANNSRTQRPSMPKLGRKVPRLRCDSHTSFKVKQSKVRVRGGRGHNMSAEPGSHTARLDCFV